MAESERYDLREQTGRSIVNNMLFEEETSFMEEYNEELDKRLDQLEESLDEKGSVVKPITPFGLGSMLALMILFFILGMISWFGGPVG